MTNEQMGMILSLIGMFINIFSFQARKRAVYLLIQSIGSIFFLLSYLFSAGGVAIYLNIISLIRNTIYMFVDNIPRTVQKRICCILCGAYIVTYILFFIFGGLSLAENLWGILPIIGSLFGTFAILNEDPIKLRIVKMGDSVSWLSFNAHLGLGALGGILGEIFNISSSLIAMYRFRKTKV